MPDEAHSSLDLTATLNRMEPGLSVPGIEQSLASIAISLKRIADHMDAQDPTALIRQLQFVENGISAAISQHSSKVILTERSK